MENNPQLICPHLDTTLDLLICLILPYLNSGWVMGTSSNGKWERLETLGAMLPAQKASMPALPCVPTGGPANA
jgi:hypothetical protein